MLDGRTTKTVITFESENILIQRQFDGKPVTIVREFGEDELIMVRFQVLIRFVNDKQGKVLNLGVY